MKKIYLILMVGIFLSSLVSAAHSLPSNFTNETQGIITGIGNWAYNVTQGTFWFLLLLGFCVVAAIATAGYGMYKSMTYAGFIGIVGSVMLAMIGWLSWFYTTGFIVVGTILIAVGFYNR